MSNRAVVGITDHAFHLVATKQLRPGDLVVLWYVAGEHVRRPGAPVRLHLTVASVAKDCGVSKGVVLGAFGRLKAVGLVEQ